MNALHACLTVMLHGDPKRLSPKATGFYAFLRLEETCTKTKISTCLDLFSMQINYYWIHSVELRFVDEGLPRRKNDMDRTKNFLLMFVETKQNWMA